MLLENAYPKWEEMVKSAKERIVVFTPYFDSTLVKLFEENKEVERILVTCINLEHLKTAEYQLKAFKEIVSLGIKVKSLKMLHAKMLYCDDDKLTIGSQNFTNRGIKNIEATTVITKEDLPNYTNLIDNWLSDADGFSNDFLSNWLNKIKPISKEEYKRDKNDNKLIYALIGEISKNKQSNSKLIFTRKGVIKKSGKHYFLEYDKVNILSNHRANMFTMLNLDNMQMALVRVSGGQITFLQRSVVSTNGKEIENDTILKIFNKKLVLKLKSLRYSMDTSVAEKFNSTIELLKDDKVYSIYSLFNGQSFSVFHTKPQLSDKAIMNITNLLNKGIIFDFSNFKFPEPLKRKSSRLNPKIKYEANLKKHINRFIGTEGKYTIKGYKNEFGDMYLTIESKK
jgi:hypothetical protein